MCFCVDLVLGGHCRSIARDIDRLLIAIFWWHADGVFNVFGMLVFVPPRKGIELKSDDAGSAGEHMIGGLFAA